MKWGSVKAQERLTSKNRWKGRATNSILQTSSQKANTLQTSRVKDSQTQEHHTVIWQNTEIWSYQLQQALRKLNRSSVKCGMHKYMQIHWHLFSLTKWEIRGLIYQSCVGSHADLSAGIMVWKEAWNLWELRTWPIRVNGSAGLDKCVGIKRSLMIEVDKDALFGSMKTKKKGTPKQRCLENNDSIAMSEWMCCCHRWHVTVAGWQVIRYSVNDHE